MPDDDREAVTLDTLHDDLAALRGETREGFADLKAGIADVEATLITGFRNMPSREQTEEMVRLLREGNRLHEERLAQLDVRIREYHLEVLQVLRALAEGQHSLLEGQRALLEGQRALHDDLRALIARLDAMLRGRGDGNPPA